MKFTTKLIEAKFDFDYGVANGLRYIQILLSFGTFFEIIKLHTNISRVWYFIIVPIGLGITYIYGKYLRKINFRKRESAFIAEQNKYLMEIYKKTQI